MDLSSYQDRTIIATAKSRLIIMNEAMRLAIEADQKTLGEAVTFEQLSDHIDQIEQTAISIMTQEKAIRSWIVLFHDKNNSDDTLKRRAKTRQSDVLIALTMMTIAHGVGKVEKAGDDVSLEKLKDLYNSTVKMLKEVISEHINSCNEAITLVEPEKKDESVAES